MELMDKIFSEVERLPKELKDLAVVTTENTKILLNPFVHLRESHEAYLRLEEVSARLSEICTMVGIISEELMNIIDNTTNKKDKEKIKELTFLLLDISRVVNFLLDKLNAFVPEVSKGTRTLN